MPPFFSASFLLTPIAFASQANAAEHRRPVVEKKVVIHKYRWTKGHRMTAAERRHMAEVRDYRRYRLSAPPRGYRWVRADNDFLLIGITSGIVSSIIAAR
ncbi:nickel/cobalt transporter regulator [Rhizobium sullae]|uniref:Nickel/cobalt transporter regulator n=1 Tax=Rhizobium sullae TaxID=50338 RepID=A0A4R3PYG5_RHISU|nr:nickel/cobalt transporter regulator [Rhizobium sullae]